MSLASSGIFHSTWFLFDKRDFPVLQTNNAALYVDYVDPGAAVLFDRAWVISRARAVGLMLTDVVPPSIRGYQWTLVMRRANESVDEITLPEDLDLEQRRCRDRTTPTGSASPETRRRERTR